MKILTERPVDIVSVAVGFAACAHKYQKRKYTGQPYVTHCTEVMGIVAAYTTDLDVICAAALHDTIEDTVVTREDIELVFGGRVAELVLEVTDVSKAEDGNREMRKRMDLNHLRDSSPDGATIKLADIISNTSSIAQYDKKFAQVYLPEKEAVLRVLSHGNQELYHRAQRVVQDAFMLLRTSGGVSTL